MKKLFAVLVMSVGMMTGCDNPANDGRSMTPTVNAPVQSSTRVIVEYAQAVQDTHAYDGYRTIFIVKDTVTGQEYIGMSGMGITELGVHPAGKTQAPDEAH